MYLREKRIKLLKIKNVVFTVLGIFFVATSLYVIISLISHYHDQLETVLEAKATPEAVTAIIIGIILLLAAHLSRCLIGDANFYSGYFEGDLSGYIQYCDLADVTGKSAGVVKLQLHFFRIFHMKGYELKKINYEELVVLNSKISICECRYCGASLEKRIYFTGICPYCGNSDLYAKVLTNNRFYSIENKVADGVKNPEFYSIQHLAEKKMLFRIYLCLGMFAIILGTIICFGNISDYNNQEYLTDVLLSGKSPYSSFALIKAEIMDNILGGAVLALAFIPVALTRCKKIKYISVADACSQFFACCKVPFVDAASLPVVTKKSNQKRILGSVRGALRHRYLLNCTFEKHENALKVALARKITKDKCPSCNGAITEAVDEHYQCKYCGNIIMGVVCKK